MQSCNKPASYVLATRGATMDYAATACKVCLGIAQQSAPNAACCQMAKFAAIAFNLRPALMRHMPYSAMNIRWIGCYNTINTKNPCIWQIHLRLYLSNTCLMIHRLIRLKQT